MPAIVLVLLLLALLWIASCGYRWGWRPFAKLHPLDAGRLPGNAAAYSIERAEPLAGSALKGTTIIFLGSSVTYGAASKGISFVDYIAKRDGCTAIKEAVSGTTLADTGKSSYIRRLERLDADHADLFVCQLSTNDATQGKPLGQVTPPSQREGFDTATVAGAIEHIIAYARNRWGCPIVFYTNPRYESAAYGEMVTLLKEIASKWDISIIELWDDEGFNVITPEERKLYMADAIHPTQAGYLKWWTPKIEEGLSEAMRKDAR